MEAQRQRRWDRKARKSGYVDIAESTVLINGCGGIGRETARLCTEMGARTIAIDPRPEGQMSGDIFPPVDLEEHLPIRILSFRRFPTLQKLRGCGI